MLGVYIQQDTNSWGSYICVCVCVYNYNVYLSVEHEGNSGRMPLARHTQKQYRHPLTLSSQLL